MVQGEPRGKAIKCDEEPRASARDGALGAFVFDGIVVALLAAGWMAEAGWPEAYYRFVSEDGPVEWATFWALVLGTVANAVLAVRAARTVDPGAGPAAATGRLTACWYPAGLALFCFLVAGEEISWGQRLLGYLPPEYFLSHNIQVEANIHNLVRPFLWSFGIQAVIAGFGIVVPLLLLTRRPARLARRVGLYVPPAGWAPGFAAMLALYVAHPYELCEELIELGLGLGFGLSALWEWREEVPGSPLAARTQRPFVLVAAAVLVALLGALSASATDGPADTDDPRVAQAEAELEALREDLVAMRQARAGKFATECNLHVRIRTIDKQVRLTALHEGKFSQVAGQLSPERARYFLDPWNMPYWISDQCDSAARYILVYSFGPDRKRDSTHWEVAGDDLGTYAFHLGTPRPGDWRDLAFPERP